MADVNYTALQATKLDNGKYQYKTSNGTTIVTTNNDGSIFVDQNGSLYAKNLQGAEVQGSNSNDNMTFYDSQINSLDIGSGTDSITAFGTTTFSESTITNFGSDDKLAMESTVEAARMSAVSGNSNNNNEALAKAAANASQTPMSADEISKVKQNYTNYETKNSTSTSTSNGTPKNSTVTVQGWGSQAQDGEKYANDCLSRIVYNQYGDLATDENMDTIYKAIMDANPQITDINTIYTGDTLNMPELNVDENGKITGAKQTAEGDTKTSGNDDVAVDGDIDANQQGGYADCWLLAGLDSLTTSEEGREQIKDMIAINDDGTYTVNLDGVNKSYTFSADDIAKAQESTNYAEGDSDVVLIELAVQQLRDEAMSGDHPELAEYTAMLNKNDTSKNDSLNYGGGCFELYDIAGIENEVYTQAYNGDEFTQKINDTFDLIDSNPESYTGTMTFANNNGTYQLNDVNGNSVVMTDEANSSAHVWSIQSVDGDNVTLINPWDSSQPITFKRDELCKLAVDISYANVSD